MEKQIVKAVQTRLQELGWYDGALDGDAGTKTAGAVQDFKGASGLNPRAFVGPITLSMLFDDGAKKRPRAALVAGVPAWHALAKTKLGLHETRDHAELAAFLRSDGTTLGDPAKLPWCGDLTETCIRLTLPKEPIPVNPYLARNWMKFGVATTPRLGAVLVFWRGSKSGTSGHVGFYVGEDATAYHVLGGNQSDAVTITRIAKDRLLGARWPASDATKTSAVKMTAAGALSTNEA